MRKQGNQLEFLYRIDGSGSCCHPIKPELKKMLETETTNYELRCLSISNGTWITSDMSTYIVKIKDGKHPDELVRFGKYISRKNDTELEQLAKEFREHEQI